MRVTHSVEDEVNLLAECVIFAKKWLCWRKWLRVSGLLEWAINGLQITTDEGTIEPVYRYEASWDKYFSALARQNNTIFTHFTLDNQQKQLTGEALCKLMIREQRMLAIEREWCRINAAAVCQNGLFQSLMKKTAGGIKVAALTDEDSHIEQRVFVEFYQRLCCRLAQVIFTGSKPKSAASRGNRVAFNKQTIPAATWRMDNLFRTFDDEIILLVMEVLDSVVSEHAEPLTALSPADSVNSAADGSKDLWLSIPIKQGNNRVVIRLNLQGRQLASTDKHRCVHKPPLNLYSVRSLLNQHLIPHNSKYFQDEVTVGKRITYGKVLLSLIDNKRLPPIDVEAAFPPQMTLASQAELNEVVKMVQLKNVARLLFCYSLWHSQPKVAVAGEEAKKRFLFFPHNGVEWCTPMTEAVLLLFSQRQNKTLTTRLNVNDGEIQGCVAIGAGVPINDAILAYRQRWPAGLTDGRKTQLFSMHVTSLLFNRAEINHGAKRLVSLGSMGIHLDTEKGFYLRHDRYPQVMMVFVPSAAVPQCDKELCVDIDSGVLIGEADNNAIASGLQKSDFLRLVLLRAEDDDEEPAEQGPLAVRVNLDDSRVLCEFLKDISRYFDPRGRRLDRLFRVDPFLSVYVDITNTAVYRLDKVEETTKCGKSASLASPVALNVKLARLLRDLPPPKSVLIRQSPVSYGPELCEHGILQRNRGIVPLALHTSEDSWKIYVYDDPTLPHFLSDDTLLNNTKQVGSRDLVDNNWLIVSDKRLAGQAILRQPVIVRMINWYDDHYPQGRPTIKKIIAKRIYLIDDVIAFCENPVKLLGGTRFAIEKVTELHDWHFANYQSPENAHLGLTKPFSQRIYKAMLDNNINLKKKKNTVRLSFYETPFFFVLFFQCSHFWFPKWQANKRICYDGVPQHLVPLIQWSIDKAKINAA